MYKIKMSRKKINGAYSSITQRIILLTFQHKPFRAQFCFALSVFVLMYHLNSESQDISSGKRMVFVWENTLINHCWEAQLLGWGKADTKITIAGSRSALCENER